MKVLLVGEFSKLHNNLQYGLRQLGVSADTLNTGDGFKKFHSDIKQFQISTEKRLDYIRKCYSKLLYQYICRKYDVVQFINELELGAKYGLEKNLGVRLAKNAKLSVLLQAGCNWQYFRYAKEKTGISPCEECLKYDIKRKYGCPVAHDGLARKTTYAFQKNVDVIVPMTYEYYICSQYSPFSEKLADPIGMPVKIDDINPSYNIKNKKLIVYHPLNREGFKGTVIIRKAFNILNKKYSDIAEFIIRGKMPYKEYFEFMKKVDIIVDQKNCISFGITSLEAMAMGKVLITGNYRKDILTSKYEYIKNAPAFELGTTVDEIVSNISNVINRRNDLEKIIESGKEYSMRYHNCIKIAKEFLKLYEQNLK